MHKTLFDLIVKACVQRQREGDCTTTEQPSPGHMEYVIAQLAALGSGPDGKMGGAGASGSTETGAVKAPESTFRLYAHRYQVLRDGEVPFTIVFDSQDDEIINPDEIDRRCDKALSLQDIGAMKFKENNRHERRVSNAYECGKRDALKDRCGKIMVGCGEDSYDPLCTLQKGHAGVCLSTSAIANFHTNFDAACPQQCADPVAWILREENDPDKDVVYLSRDEAVCDSLEGDEIIPLFTHPATAQPSTQREEDHSIPLAVRTAPERIWLQLGEDPEYLDKPFPRGLGEELTWCEDSVVDAEVAYIRADLCKGVLKYAGRWKIESQHRRRMGSSVRDGQ
jgi:hypothetical protein